jgi:hypothetical protein
MRKFHSEKHIPLVRYPNAISHLDWKKETKTLVQLAKYALSIEETSCCPQQPHSELTLTNK